MKHENEYKEIIETAFEVIKREKLPTPVSIRIRRSLSGTRKRRGVCHIDYTTNDYRISVTNTESKFYEDPNGKFTDNKTGIKFSRALIGIERSYKVIIEVMAHEIAHLKFWKHDAQHKSYTNYILNKMINGLGDIYV